MGLNKELDGFTVVSLEQAIAAPYCGLLLADAGARVIKVERPDGDFARRYDTGANGQSSIFAWVNRGKESVCIDLNIAEDAQLMRRMLSKADVFVHNLAPNALARRGFDQETLRAANPGLVNCEVTGYGREGGAAKKKAYDFLVQAESGICSITGTAESPARVGVSIVDISTGLTAFSAVLRALLQRSRTGLGCDLNISMFDVMADWMNMSLMGHRYMGGAPKRLGMSHAQVTPYGAYTTSDGGQVMLAVQNDREWSALCSDVLKKPELASDARFANNPDRVANRDAMNVYVEPALRALTREQALGALEKSGIACANLNSVEDLDQHPFLRNQVAHFAGMTLQVADLPVRTDNPRPTHSPSLDEHGNSIRAEFAATAA
ncbi:MAG: CaiB/BaiF CoA-transferase family protein [Burkholderiaceae bacterium]